MGFFNILIKKSEFEKACLRFMTNETSKIIS